MIELREGGLHVEIQIPVKVFYEKKVVGEYIIDILVEKKVVVELKTVEKFDNVHEAQLLNYLKASGIKVGLLINFKHPKVEIKRMVLDLPEGHDI